MEKLFGTPELLVMIYNKLTLADQIRLAQVHSSLSRIYASLIFPVNYCNLKILDSAAEVLVSNQKDEDCILLEHDELENFLKFSAGKVEKLYVRGMNHLISSCEVYCRNVRNLTCLCLRYLTLSEKQLLLIGLNCPELSELRLIYCEENVETGRPLMVGESISVSTLEKMKNLKILEVLGRDMVDGHKIDKIIKFSLFYELIKKVPLECLKLDAMLDQDVYRKVKEINFHRHFKELEISLDVSAIWFLKCTGIFKNLSKLHLNNFYVVDDDLQILANACENLESLTFGQDTTFDIYKHFVIPPNLKELYIYTGTLGLTDEHLEEVLTKFKIEKFCTGFYEENHLFQDFIISPYIKVLHLAGLNTTRFPFFYANNNALREIHFYGIDERSVRSATQNWEIFKTCKNLEQVFIYVGYVPIEGFLELEHLHKLKIWLPCDKLNWSNMIDLLKHPCLKELQIDYVDNRRLKGVTNIRRKGITSTITLIALSLDLLEMGLDFWLDMLQKNPKMLLRCDYINRYDDRLALFLKALIRHENFPKDLKEIKLWGFNLDCKDLRENFLATIKPLTDTDYLHQNKTLALSRKQN